MTGGTGQNDQTVPRSGGQDAEPLEQKPVVTEPEFTQALRQTFEQFEQTQERINKRSGRNLLLAIAMALLLGAVFLGSLLFVKELFLIFLALVIAFGTYEFANALRAQKRDVPRVASVIAAVAQIFCAYYFGNVGQLFSLAGAVLLVILWRTAELLRKSHRGSAQELFFDYGAGVLVQVYLGFLASFAALVLRNDDGQWWVIAFVIIVVSIDTSALFAGVLWGKHKFVPKISPSKTWEGFAGSVVGGTVAAILLVVFLLGESWWVGLILGLSLVASATIGDLTESLMKRDLGIKDMSSFLPGHGGFMDRLDSMLPSCLMSYIVFSIFVL